jgi:membrane protease YdiL (CAAX protease family)
VTVGIRPGTSAAGGAAATSARDPDHGVLAAIRRHPLGAYFFLAYLFSWSYWVPLALAGGHRSHFPGLLGPMLAALVVSAAVTGRAGTDDLLRRMLRWRVPVRWYAAALVPPAAAAVALAVTSALAGGSPSLDRLARMPGLPVAGWFTVFVLVFLVNGYGEETGWRGFAWPRLRERHGLAGAALMLSVPWALWHLPTFWLDTGLRGFPPLMIPGFLLGMAAGAVVLGWLFEHAHGSVLVVALFHATLNMASATEATEDVAPAASAVVIAWAVLILRAEQRRTTDRATALVVGRRNQAK